MARKKSEPKEHGKRIPEVKVKQVKDLAEQILKSRTLMIVDIMGLQSPQLQQMKKDLRQTADIKVAKKNIFLRTVKELKKANSDKLEQYIKENCAFLISEMDGFELAGMLADNKTPVFAKAGQLAPEDIEIKEGPTDLAPGPAISEFGILGIQIGVEDGKIAIKKSKIVIKKGDTIKENLAAMFQKLDIKPFEVGLNPIAIYDLKEDKIYADIKIDKKQFLENLRQSSAKALGFAQSIAYYCKETIGYLLAKANVQANALNKLGNITTSNSSEAEEATQTSSEEDTTDTKEQTVNDKVNSAEAQQ